jgi:predicted peptidase
MGERGTGLTLVKKWGVTEYREAGGKLSAYAVAPQCPEKFYWNHLIDDLNSLLDGVLASHPIDEDRVILTGFSMGGFGTCEWAYRSPDRFAALVPVAGTVVPSGKQQPCALSTIPMWVIHSQMDKSVPVDASDAFVNLMTSCGGQPKYSRYEEEDHVMTAMRAYHDQEVYDWMLSQRRSNS